MIETFLLVMSLWGFNGTDWVYVGNQYVNQEFMTREECLEEKDKWFKYEDNEYYRLSLECQKI